MLGPPGAGKWLPTCLWARGDVGCRPGLRVSFRSSLLHVREEAEDEVRGVCVSLGSVALRHILPQYQIAC